MFYFTNLINKWRESNIKDLENRKRVEEELRREKEMYLIMDEYIKLENFEKIGNFVASGYKLSSAQVVDFLYKVIKRNTADDDFPISMVKHIAVNHRKNFNEVMNYHIKHGSVSERDLFHILIINHSEIRELLDNDALIYIIGRLSDPKEHYFHKKMQSILTERTSARHDDILGRLKKSETATGQNLKEILKDIPAYDYIKKIEDNLTKIDVEALNSIDRAELKDIVDVTLPNIIMKYAAIDKTTYKQNKSIDTLLQDSLSNIEQKINNYRQTTEDAKVKDFKIAAKMSASR